MRFNSIPALAAVLSLGVSGVFSRAIPETNGVETSAGNFAEDTTLCIKDFCATKGDKKQTTTQCGPVILTITHLGVPVPVEECVGQFSKLMAQDTESGASQTEEAVYEISAEDDIQLAAKEKRTPTKSKSRTSGNRTSKNTKSRNRQSRNRKTKTSKSKNRKNKNKNKKNKGKTPKACPLPKKGKNGKTIHKRCAGDEFFHKRDLMTGVTHWKFNTMGDIKTYEADAHAKAVLQKMHKDGQLDVVKVTHGALTVMGTVPDPDTIGFMRGTDPNKFMKQGGNYLLTNGGFFQHMETKSRPFEPAGEDTMVKTLDGHVLPFDDPFPLPADYAEYYAKIDGQEGTRVYSGPNLKQTIPGISTASGIWNYNENDPILVGRLSHASQPNERLALVTFAKTHYSIAYTCSRRECGVNTNQFKEIIDLFFTKMGETGKSIHSSTQAVCLDGGPSISMTWNEGHKVEKLTLGGAGDLTPAPGANGRKVSNLIKIDAK